MSVKWYGEKFRKYVEAKCLKNMKTACRFVETQIKESISGPSPSAPGEPPGVVTGTLRRSYTHEVEKTPHGIVGRVGTNMGYALPLELGTSKMAARPHIRPGLEKSRKGAAKILSDI